MKKKNKGRYLKKFKSYAINLVVNDGLSVYSAAKQLSMPKSTLAGWVRKLQGEKSIKKSVLPKEPPLDSAEIEQLKQELAKVKTERDDLKKKAEVIPYSPDGYLEPLREDAAIIQLYTENTESLLDTARMQWQFGDWESLVKLDENKLQYHPDRAKLALLVATGWQQLNDQKKTHKYIKLSRKWGCDKQLIARLLIAGVHNTLGCAAAAGRQENRALKHFRSAVKGVNGDAGLACQARSVREFTKLGLLQQAAKHIGQELNGILPKDISVFSREPSLNQIEPQAKIVPEIVAPSNSRDVYLKVKKHQHKQVEPINKQKVTQLAAYLNKQGEALYGDEQFKEAAVFFQQALELESNSAYYCQNLAETIARLEYKPDSAWYCQSLAVEIEKAGKWDAAVRLYRRALKLDANTVRNHQQSQTFTFEDKNEENIPNPVFIIGCGHSGTSLMLALLGNHPSFYPVPKESALFLRTDTIFQRIIEEWDAICKNQNKARWIEKTPPHIFQIRRFLNIRPESKFILMLRDGRDVVCSLKHREGYEGVADRIDRWVYDNLAGISYWQHPQLMVVKYEDLVTDPPKVLKDICHFLGEDYSEKMLEFHRTEHLWYSDKIVKPDSINSIKDHQEMRNWQINQPLYDGRGLWTTELTSEEKIQFKNSPAQYYLERFGYVNNREW